MNLRLGLSLMTVLAVAACRGGGEDEGTGSETGTGTETGDVLPEEIELDEFFGFAEAAFCEWAVECHAFGVEARCGQVMHFENRMSMRMLTGVGSDESLPTAYYKEAVEVGRVVYDKKLAATCLEYVRARSCDIPQYHVDTEEEIAGRLACAGVFEGRMGKNGPCLSAIECAEAAVCGYDPTCMDMCCVGACRVLPAPLALGEDCSAGNRPCEAGTYCRFDQDLGMSTVCSTPPTAGQPCPDFVCGGGADCDFVNDSPVCIAGRPAGAACDYGDQCEDDLECVRDQNYENGVCLAPAEQGEACDWRSNDLVCRRFDNFCDPMSGVCSPLPGNGEPCYQYSCRGDFFCAEGNGQRCSPVADVGERCGYVPSSGNYIPCSGDNVCAGDDFENQSCVAPGADSLCPVPVDPLAGG